MRNSGINCSRLTGFKMKNKKPIKPLPFFVYFSVVAFLALAGFWDSVYLAWSHYRNYTDMAYQSFCAISKAINCDTVSQSLYSIFGGVPWAVWGLMAYGFLILLLVQAFHARATQKRMWTIIFLLSFIFSGISISLAIVSTVYIHSYCIMCVLSFAINFLLLYFSWIIRKRFGAQKFIGDMKEDLHYVLVNKKTSLWLYAPFICCSVLIIIFFPKYWVFKSLPSHSSLTVGITQDGHPWIGAEQPVLEITEFTDYQCFQCKKMHFYLRQLIQEHPDEIRLIHRHYPLDHKYNFAVKDAFHVGSGDFALLAIYAATKGKFWEMNDLLYNVQTRRGSVKIKDLADKVGLNFKELSRSLYDKTLLTKLRIDLWEGNKLGITGTPAYVIDGKVYKGQIPPEIISAALK